MKKANALFIIGLVAAVILTGCSVLKDKTVAIESRVYGVNLEVPNVNSSTSMASLKMGVIVTRFADAPNGGEVDMSSNYNDISVWSGAGSGATTFKVKGPSALSESDAVDSDIATK